MQKSLELLDRVLSEFDDLENGEPTYVPDAHLFVIQGVPDNVFTILRDTTKI